MSDTDGGDAVDESAVLAQLKRLSPFVRRAGLLVTGREKLSRLGGGRIRLIICTKDLSENSLKEIRNDCPNIPIYRAFSSEMLAFLYGVENTKILGLKSNGLSSQVAKALQPYLLSANVIDNDKKKTVSS